MGKKTESAKKTDNGAAPVKAAAKRIASPVTEKAVTEKTPVAKKAAAPKETKTPKAAAAISSNDIALRAYFISEKRRAQGLAGSEHHDWLEAERQLRDETAKKPATTKSRAKKTVAV